MANPDGNLLAYAAFFSFSCGNSSFSGGDVVERVRKIEPLCVCFF
uniref:Uncharacterized protein n=1 Tax=Arundo donax TaxID=35708 RepID=A0A0A8ZS44_ARUDO